MKKTMLAVILSSLLFLAGCGASTTLTTFLTTAAMPSDTILAMLGYAGNHTRSDAFDASFEAIRIDTLKGAVCFTMTIEDADYEDYYYYLVMADATMQTNIDINQYVIHASAAEADYCVSGFTGSDTYEVWVAKSMKSAYFTTVTAYPMAGFSFQIPSMARRAQLGELGMTASATATPDAAAGLVSVKIGITIDDPEEILTALYVIAKTADGGVIAFETRIASVDAIMVGNVITVVDLAISGLTPGIRYTYYLYATGHDGVTPFTDRLIYTGTQTCPSA